MSYFPAPLEVLGIVLPVLIFPVYAKLCRRFAPSWARPLLAIRRYHNVLLALFSFWITLRVLRLDPGRWTSPHRLVCSVAVPDPLLDQTWYASKFWEWLDTALLLAAGKPISSLHYNHHMTTAAVVLSNSVGMEEGSISSVYPLGVVLNGAVHTLMYAYYAWPRQLRPIRQLITLLQLVQHVIVTAGLIYTAYQWFYGQCGISVVGHVIALACYPMYLIQFAIFYHKTYPSPTKAQASKR